MKIPRIPDKYIRPLWLAAWALAGFGNLTAVLLAGGNWINLLAGSAFGALAVAGYRQRVRDHEDHQAMLGRKSDIAWWHSRLESDSFAERQAASDLLAYWGVPAAVDPLGEPTRGPSSPSGVSSAHRRGDAADRRAPDRTGGPIVSQVPPRTSTGLDPVEVQATAHQIVNSGRDLKGVIRLRESHENRSQSDSALWIAACKLLEEAAAERAGYTQDFDEIAVRSVGGGVSAVYRHPDGPTPREQMLAEFQRAKEEAEDGTRRAFIVAGPVLESGSGRILPRSYPMSRKIHDRR